MSDLIICICPQGFIEPSLQEVKYCGEREIGIRIPRDPDMCEFEEIDLSASDARRLAIRLLLLAEEADEANAARGQ